MSVQQQPAISVCMATYGGARYVVAQLESILDQLAPQDEVIVVDDASPDDTVASVRAVGDSRVHIVANRTNAGHARAFERALSMASGRLVFLADQDDIWPPGRVDLMRNALEDVHLVIGNVVTFDGKPVRPQMTTDRFVLRQERHPPRGRTMALLCLSQVPYYGCAMGMTREMVALSLPFPTAARELHDGWIGLLGLWSGSVAHLDAPVVRRREHAGNATGRVRSPWKVLRGRWWFVAMVVQSRLRYRARRRAGRIG